MRAPSRIHVTAASLNRTRVVLASGCASLLPALASVKSRIPVHVGISFLPVSTPFIHSHPYTSLPSFRCSESCHESTQANPNARLHSIAQHHSRHHCKCLSSAFPARASNAAQAHSILPLISPSPAKHQNRSKSLPHQSRWSNAGNSGFARRGHRLLASITLMRMLCD